MGWNSYNSSAALSNVIYARDERNQRGFSAMGTWTSLKINLNNNNSGLNVMTSLRLSKVNSGVYYSIQSKKSLSHTHKYEFNSLHKNTFHHRVCVFICSAFVFVGKICKAQPSNGNFISYSILSFALLRYLSSCFSYIAIATDTNVTISHWHNHHHHCQWIKHKSNIKLNSMNSAII